MVRSAAARIVVGLGNPGGEYEGTRHNIGFAAVDLLARRLKASFRPRGAECALADGRGREAGPFLLVKPLAYMNRSGEALRKIFADLDGSIEETLVLLDDFNLDLGRLRLRAAGSDGGHNGLRSLIERFGTERVPRLRLGIGPPPARLPAEVYVLRRFWPWELEEVDEMVARAADAAQEWIGGEDVETLMNRYNRQ
ncbi:MAG: aminoacyl-tRNA hydrolase [Planctomycetes bacterium]|nr:aminoacyl-tRNA hydrolase [Planctomycetota bacterium]